ncbi:DNA damage-regulated autophagy modulator protein 2-like isoform X2 [Scleropages formosus]|uniref:DNA damage-regulated autophagy modulator protein 2-like isoform X2 n=1 Tax=Scleropages formosus TaxID=113540 RepID=UPI000878038C|nr:DNA damage-regulated autophagy modulator protein 2-like isoform X2 [Scleropages formosus]
MLVFFFFCYLCFYSFFFLCRYTCTLLGCVVSVVMCHVELLHANFRAGIKYHPTSPYPIPPHPQCVEPQGSRKSHGLALPPCVCVLHSDSGTQPPERCLFGVMLIISCFLGTATTYVRYKQVKALTSWEDRSVRRLNTAGLWLGLGSSFGMCIVANFQKTIVISLHVLGAAMTFGLGTLYILVQAAVSHGMQPHVHGKDVFWVRLGVALWSLASVIVMFLSSVIVYVGVPDIDIAKKLHWLPQETGYAAHLVSTISEWSLAFSFVAFFLTYIRDFQKISLRAEAVLQSTHLYNTSYNAGVRGRPGERAPLLAGSL